MAMRNLILLLMVESALPEGEDICEVLVRSAPPPAASPPPPGTEDQLILITRAGGVRLLDSHGRLHPDDALVKDSLPPILSESPPLPGPPPPTLASSSYLASSDSLLVATPSGELAQVPLTPGSPPQVVGVIDSGVRHLAWAPDEALLLLATGGGSLVRLTPAWDLLDELPSRGAIHVAWRPDGDYFLSVHVEQTSPPAPPTFRVRVWERRGVLHGTSPPFPLPSPPGPPPQVTWRPSGELIAVAHEGGISLLERNCLPRGQLPPPPAPSTPTPVLALDWDSSGAVLAVLRVGRVELWGRANYHWALLKTLTLGGPRGEGRAQVWLRGAEHPALLVLTSLTLLRLDLAWDSTSPRPPPPP